MECSEIDFQVNEAEFAHRPRRLRWVLWGLMIFCALMISLVVVSQIRIANRAQGDPSRLAGGLSVPRASTGTTAPFADAADMPDGASPVRAPAPIAANPPRVRALPNTRTPARRTGLSVEG